jgi:phenylacetate-CoA ligase
MITLDNENYSDHMLVEVELNEDSITDDTLKLAEMARKLDVRLKEILNIKAEVRLALPKTLPRFEGKSKHVVDNRSYE